MSIWALIKTGGWVMAPLLVCSIVVWAVVLERFLSLRGWQERNKHFLLSFSNLWFKGDTDGARELSNADDSELAILASEYLKEKNGARAGSKMERKRLEQAMALKKFLWILGSIGSSAPFIGLFGTVVGIIRAFEAMAQTGAGGFTVVAAGISEALVATAAGILVAVISVMFYNYFQTRVSQLQFQFRLMSDELQEVLGAK